VDALAGYNCDFLLLPEFFNAPLLSNFNQDNPAEAMRGLSQYTDEIREAMLSLAVSYNINIIAGSMPVYDEASKELYNVSYLLRGMAPGIPSTSCTSRRMSALLGAAWRQQPEGVRYRCGQDRDPGLL
jgi:hypothetical protein